MADNAGEDNTNNQGASAPPATGSIQAIINHLMGRKVDAALFVVRLVTVFTAFLFIFPLLGNQQSMYSKALLAGAATNALRLHQRTDSFQFSRAFLSNLFMEDSCHYLFYCLVFLGAFPISMSLFPILMFAVLHSSSFAITLLNVGRMENGSLWRLLSKLVTEYSQSILQMIAMIELFLMPLLVFMCFTGRGSIIMPFVYYRFLSLRYVSRRNPHTRQSFTNLRISLEQAVNRPGCPPMIRNVASKIVGLVSRLAPQMAA